MSSQYPRWKYYPSWRIAPDWVSGVVEVVANARRSIDSSALAGDSAPQSNTVLQHLGVGLVECGFTVETPESKVDRPVLFGENGATAKRFQLDGWHDADGVALEVEAGKAWEGKAALLDLIKMSLILDCRFGAIIVPQRYERGKRYADPYNNVKDLFDAIFANPERLRIALEGVLLVGY
jgi:hypothetical protein